MENTKGLDQSFTVKNFQRLLKRTDFHGSTGYRSIEQLMPRLERLENDIMNGAFTFSPFNKGSVNGFDFISAPNLEARLALRKLDDNIKRIFRIKTSNRSAIIGLTKHLCEEDCKFHIIKLDLKKFYESIPHQFVINKISKNNLLSNTSKLLLSSYSNLVSSHQHLGLPRGICLSSTLSEYYMKPIDKKIKSIDGIYYYSRFVDDIIVFSYLDGWEIYKKIKLLIERPLSLNPTKTKIMSNSVTANPIDFDFLGYRFTKDKELKIDIAVKKIKKIKSRIIHSILDFGKNGNSALLLKRIVYLSSNFKLSGSEKKENIISGIHYNYYLAKSCEASLRDLDVFLRGNLFSNKGIASNRGISIPAATKKKIEEISFYSGFSKIITHNYSMSEVSEIKRCWHGK